MHLMFGDSSGKKRCWVTDK